MAFRLSTSIELGELFTSSVYDLQAVVSLTCERAAERVEQRLDLAGDHVVAAERGAVEREHRGRVARAAAGAEHHVRHHLARLHVTPQALNSVGRVELDGIGGMPGICSPLVEVRVGVDERDQLAAAHHELVERVLGLRRHVARMDQQQHVEVLVDLLRHQRHFLHLEVALELVGEHPRLGRLARERVELLAQHRQPGHQADLRPLGAADARDGAHQVVLEQALALRRDHRDRLLAVELAHRDAEVELLAGHQLLRLDAVELRRVLVLGVGLRVEPLEMILSPPRP